MKKHALRLLAALLAAAAVAGLAAAPMIYFKISDKLLLNREFTTDELPQIAIGSSEIEFLKGAEEYLCGTAYETTAEECGVEEMISAMDDFLSAMPFLEEMKIAVMCSLNEASYCDAYGTEHVKTYTCYNKDYVMPAQEVVAAVEDGTQKVVAFSIRFSAEISIADSESERLKFMEKYLEYSTLDVLPDWKYNGSRYYSETVGLFLNVVLDDENKIIYIGLER